MRKFKLHTNPAALPQDTLPCTLLIPFWGKPDEDPHAPESGRYDIYIEKAPTIFELVPLEEADAVLIPGDWQSMKSSLLLDQLIQKAKAHGKPLVVFYWHDSTDSIPIEGAMVFRTSIVQSRRGTREFAMPAWSEDFVERYTGGEVAVRTKRSRPVIGYCGYADGNRGSFLETRLAAMKKALLPTPKRIVPLTARELRTQALTTIQRSKALETNFVLRKSFWGGAYAPGQAPDMQQVRALRHEFVNNMINSDYLLVARGAGNYSYRFYEVLSCGRIPVFINTDSALPYDFLLNYRDFVVWVEESDLSTITDQICDFHANLSQSDFIDLQYRCRQLWLDWLSPQGFFTNFYRHFEAFND
jgi:hypothetical protein